MNITILGTGNAATTVGADLTLKGHQVTLLKTSNSNLHSEHYKFLLSENGKVYIRENDKTEEVNIYKITEEVSEAITENTDLIIMYVQTNYHKSVIKKIVPFLNKNQMILVEPGYLITPYFLELGRDDLIIIEAESSPIDCRITEPGKVDVLFRNVRNPIGVYPENESQNCLRVLNELEYNFVLLDSVIEAALHNPNIIVHTVGAIMSIPRIEFTNGEYWMYKEVFTKSIWNLVERLDSEKMKVLSKIGLPPIAYVDKCQYRNSNDLSIDSKEVFFEYAYNNSPKGPNVSDSRYITEDVSQGLVLLEILGEILNVDTVICSSLINISSASLGIDFRKNGRSYNKSMLKDFIFHETERILEGTK